MRPDISAFLQLALSTSKQLGMEDLREDTRRTGGHGGPMASGEWN